jgi:hypothetical protein
MDNAITLHAVELSGRTNEIVGLKSTDTVKALYEHVKEILLRSGDDCLSLVVEDAALGVGDYSKTLESIGIGDGAHISLVRNTESEVFELTGDLGDAGANASHVTLKTDDGQRVELLENGLLVLQNTECSGSKFKITKAGDGFNLLGLPGGERIKFAEAQYRGKSYLRSTSGQFVCLDPMTHRVKVSSKPAPYDGDELQVDMHEEGAQSIARMCLMDEIRCVLIRETCGEGHQGARVWDLCSGTYKRDPQGNVDCTWDVKYRRRRAPVQTLRRDAAWLTSGMRDSGWCPNERLPAALTQITFVHGSWKRTTAKFHERHSILGISLCCHDACAEALKLMSL